MNAKLFVPILTLGVCIVFSGCGKDEDDTDEGSEFANTRLNQFCRVYIRLQPGTATIRSAPAPGGCGPEYRAGEVVEATKNIPGISFRVEADDQLVVRASTMAAAGNYETELRRTPNDTTHYMVTVGDAPRNHSVTLRKVGSMPPDVIVRGELCSGTECTYSFEAGSRVVFEPLDLQTRTFTWAGDCTSWGPKFGLIEEVTRDVFCEVTFSDPTDTKLHLEVVGPHHGRVSVQPTAQLGATCPREGMDEPICTFHANMITLRAEPSGNGEFVGWSGDCMGMAPEVTLDASMTMPPMNGWTCTATFREKPVDCATIGTLKWVLRPSRTGTPFGTNHFNLTSPLPRLYLDILDTQRGDNPRYQFAAYNDDMEREIINEEVRPGYIRDVKDTLMGWGGSGTLTLSLNDSCGTRTATATYSILE